MLGAAVLEAPSPRRHAREKIDEPFSKSEPKRRVEDAKRHARQKQHERQKDGRGEHQVFDDEAGDGSHRISHAGHDTPFQTRMNDAFDLSLFGNEALPLVVSPKRGASAKDVRRLVEEHGAALKKKLLEHGGLLFRGFAVGGAADFQGVIDALSLGPSLDYIGGDSPRKKITGSVYTSTEAPRSFKIPLHNELSFVSRYPKHILFFCDVEPSDRGETIIADARRVYRQVDGDVRRRFDEKGLKYVSSYYGRSRLMEVVNPSHKSWRQVFETDDPARVEALCREHAFAFEWHGDNWIKISQTRPATTTHPETREHVWFSQPHLYDFNPRLLGTWQWLGAKLFYARRHTRLHEVFHADGSPIARSDIYHLLDTLDACTVSFPWKRGDVLLLDNVLSMHGRAPFTGERRILAAMTG
jgi:alpha-ketoglutarate-dependent taurine dioxygenase